MNAAKAGPVKAAQIISLAADGRLDEAWAVIDDVARGDDGREVMMALACNAVVPLRLLAERLHRPVEELLMLGPAGVD